MRCLLLLRATVALFIKRLKKEGIPYKLKKKKKDVKEK